MRAREEGKGKRRGDGGLRPAGALRLGLVTLCISLGF